MSKLSGIKFVAESVIGTGLLIGVLIGGANALLDDGSSDGRLNRLVPHTTFIRPVEVRPIALPDKPKEAWATAEQVSGNDV